MKRRTFVRAIAGAGISGIAGCTETGPGQGGPGNTATDTPTDAPTGEPTDTATGTPTGTPTDVSPGEPTDTATDTPPSGSPPTSEPTPTPTPGSPRVTGTSFEVVENTCGEKKNRATVEWTDRSVKVTGVISGSNACYTAELERARYDAEADELRVDVRSYNPETQTACAQCIVEIDYRSTVEFEGGTPGSVVVRHNGDRVERATR